MTAASATPSRPMSAISTSLVATMAPRTLTRDVEPAEVFEHAVVAPSPAVRAAEPLAAVRLAEETGGGELGIAPVPTREVPVADHDDAPGLTVGHRLAVLVDEPDGHTLTRVAHGHRTVGQIDVPREVPRHDPSRFGRTE